MTTDLRSILAAYDGKSVDTLEALVQDCPATDALLTELVEHAADSAPRIQAAATWLLRRYLQDGHELPTTAIDLLAARLARIDDPWACLHLCQSMTLLCVPARHAEAFALFLRRSLAMPSKFVRAWAYDGFFRLGQQHHTFEQEALQYLVKAQEEEAPSVRARVRKILEELASASRRCGP